jgi:hypothetical protein
MRAGLATIVAGAALALAPVAGLAQSDDDAPIATAPEASRAAAEAPPPEPQSYAAPPSAYAPPPAPYAPPPPSYAPPPPSYAPPPRQQSAEAPPPAPYTPPPAASYAAPPPQTPPAGQDAQAAQQRSAGAGGAVAFAAPQKRPSFLADMASKDAMAGALSFAGAAIAINQEMKAGDKLVVDDSIDDPAQAIARQVAADYAAVHGGAVADQPADWDGASASGAHFLVKVATSGWGFTYYPLDWNHYHLTYDAKLEVVDIATKQVVAKAACSHKADPASEHFTYEAMTENGGAVLKSQLKAIADECVVQFRAAVQKT